MAKTSKKKRKSRERQERRFFPKSTRSPALVSVLGGVGAATLGAGTWAQFGRTANAGLEPLGFAPWVVAGGAVLVGLAVWVGTSGEPVVRVGDAGVAIEKGGILRVPWHAVEQIRWDENARTVSIRGDDEIGVARTITVAEASQPDAVAWILKEVAVRIPDRFDISESARSQWGEPNLDGGMLVELDPVQVVGKRCRESGKVIAYEPDARVCARCERVFHKDHVPKTCACGGSLSSLRVN